MPNAATSPSTQRRSGYARARPPAAEAVSTGRAVLYLRVSTPSQVRTDYDPEGLSIPAQRSACERKIEQLGLTIVDEYVEPGRTATSMDKRPAFQAMLTRIKTERDVDFVVVYKLSRMNRNRIDDALVVMSLRQLQVTLISATEHIDETPIGQLMHGILATINEFRSAEDGADIRYKMGEKARRGGTLGLAPLGYLNVREQFDGREIRTVAVDPERGPLVTVAFDLYATGRYTGEQLRDELTKRGLRTRPGKHPAGPVSLSKLQAMLHDRYYLGFVYYDGEEIPGRHEALVTQEVFDRVQAVLEAKTTSGERQRRHHHYLKGSLWCGACHDQGRTCRLIIQRAVGRQQQREYFYFFCRGRQQHVCDMPYLDMDSVEEAVADYYGDLQLTPAFAARVRDKVREALGDEQQASKLLRRQLTKELATLDRQEENLLDLVADGELVTDKAKARLRKLRATRERLAVELQRLESDLGEAADAVELTLCLLADPEALYRRMDDQQRRQMNQAFFEKLYVDVDGVSEACLTAPVATLVEAQGLVQEGWTDPGESVVASKTAVLLATALVGGGSSKTAVVDLGGFEPPTFTMPWCCATELRYRPVEAETLAPEPHGPSPAVP
ncbi:MAG: site-specific recombinase [Actinomycetota bacterium]|nr:site-specific recombinase [Actinomycetota bacterium]